MCGGCVAMDWNTTTCTGDIATHQISSGGGHGKALVRVLSVAEAGA